MARHDNAVCGSISSKQGFYIGDICYVLADDIYYDFWGKGKEYSDGVFEVNGFSFAVGSTAYGDGVYFDENETVTNILSMLV